MLLSLDEIRGYHIRAKDGQIGKASDCFFDDQSWIVRYLVVDTGWLFGRKALVAPSSIEKVDVTASELAVGLNRQQIEGGPGMDADMPVSRQQEIALADHYGWPRYWEVYPVGTGPLVPPIFSDKSDGGRSREEAEVHAQGDPHLRSASEVEGYYIEAEDGEIGHVEDFIFGESSWAIRYLVIDTRNWLPGRKVIIAPTWAHGIDWANRVVQVALRREAIKNSPRYEPGRPIGRDFELAMHRHYGREPYWA